MNKTFIFSCVCVFLTQIIYGQLKVANSGNVGIQLGTSTPLSALSIGGAGDVNTKLTVEAPNSITGLSVNRTGTYPYSWLLGLISSSEVTYGKSTFGVMGKSYNSTFLGGGRSWGIYGYAGNSTSGYNYGVMGIHAGTGNGAGVVGTVNGNQDVNVPGIYAGYFVGNVYVTGTLTGNPVVNSDKRYKKNIFQLNTKTTLNNVLQMTPVEYNLNQIYTKSKGDSTVVQQALYDEKSQVFLKKHYGLIAQDLQKLYPDLVYEDDNGYLSVNYIGLIPMLIESIKELNSEIETLKTKTNVSSKPSNVKASSDTHESDIDLLSYPVLDQNVPNPFNTATNIGFYLPSTIANANIYVYDMNGIQLKNYEIIDKGKGNVTIEGSEFSAGMYLYALIADGKVIDTKRMILTK